MILIVWLFALSYASWALLCLGLPRHFQQHFDALPSATNRRLLRAGGWLLLLAAFTVAVRQGGWGTGSVIFTAVWMLAAMTWVLLQTYRYRAARWLAPMVTALAAITWICH